MRQLLEFSIRTGTVVLALIALSAPIGCGGSNKPKAYPTAGEVYFQGKPAEGASVVFVPLEAGVGSVYPSGEVDGSGAFRLTSFKADDGAPAGEYAIVLNWQKTEVRNGEVYLVERDKFGGRFANVAVSNLRAEVKKEKNQIKRIDVE